MVTSAAGHSTDSHVLQPSCLSFLPLKVPFVEFGFGHLLLVHSSQELADLEHLLMNSSVELAQLQFLLQIYDPFELTAPQHPLVLYSLLELTHLQLPLLIHPPEEFPNAYFPLLIYFSLKL